MCCDETDMKTLKILTMKMLLNLLCNTGFFVITFYFLLNPLQEMNNFAIHFYN